MIKLNNIKKIIKICNDNDVIPIIFGGVAYFLRTFDFGEIYHNKVKYDREFKDIDFIVTSSDLEILKNKFIELGYELDLTWINGYVGYVKGDSKNPYTIEDSSGIQIGPKRFELKFDNFVYDFDALDEFIDIDEHTTIQTDGLVFKIASVDILKECLSRELKYGWADSNEKEKLERLEK